MSMDETGFASRTVNPDALDEVRTNPDTADSLAEIIDRRAAIKKMLGIGALGAVGVWPLAGLAAPLSGVRAKDEDAPARPFGFEEIHHGVDRMHHVSPGHRAQILMRWGDAVIPGAPVFDPRRQSAAAQLRQFGYNNDFIGYIPLPYGSGNSAHGLLCINHEYTNARMMFPASAEQGRPDPAAIVDIEMACNGGSVIEVRKEADGWRQVADSRFARRINAFDSAMRISGPAAGHARLRTSADPTGTRVIGTLNNCAGGITPWGTYLMAEENFNKYFLGRLQDGHPEQQNFRRYGVPGGAFSWGRHHPRFDIGHEPGEANRFGWIVEVDPFDPLSTPVKRTALGRFKHEGAECIVNANGRLVLYSGDDQPFEFLYRFVSRDPVDPDDRLANRDLLDHGTLYAARFDQYGGLRWLPLVYGQAGLDEHNGFRCQADVVIEARRAASILGATPMDRPEDVEPNPVTGKVYVMLTRNPNRGRDQRDAVNPRPGNRWGQIVEITPDNHDHAAETARWELLVRAGNPDNTTVAAEWNRETSENGWFSCPDNCAIDPDGRLWVCTDQGSDWKTASGTADGLWAVQTEGPGRATGRMFFRVPVGAELCGPRFTPDGRTLFLSVQHPGVSGTRHFPGFERKSTFDDPATRWPDFDPQMPPRPSVVVVTREDDGKIGG